MSNESVARQRGWVVLGLALLVGFALRVEYLRELILSPFGRHLLLDAEWYDQAARLLLAGDPIADGRAYFRPPGYPLFLSWIYAVFDGRVDAVRMIQGILGLAHVPLCWMIARRTHGERVAGVAAVLAATYGMFIYFEGEILTTSLGTLLTTLGILLLLEGDARSSLLWTGLGGIAVGLAATLHATALAIAPAAFLWTLARERRRFLHALMVLIGVTLPVGAVTARNWMAGGELVLLGSQGGINFFVGNNPDSDGKSALAPGFAEAAQTLRPGGDYRDTIEIAAEALVARELGRAPTPGETNRYWLARGLEWVRDQPRDAVTLLARKVVFFWNGYEISNNRDLRDQARRFTPILRLFLVQWAIVLPFVLFGFVLPGIGTRPRRLLAGTIVAYALVVTAFFVCARYRQPAIAWMIPFGAAGLVYVFDELRTSRDRPLRLMGVGALLFVFFLFTNPRFVTATGIADVTTDRDAPFHRFNLGVLYEQEGDLDRAIEEYRATTATGIQDPRVYLNLGNSLARTGRLDEARQEYREVLRMAPDYGPAVRSNLGILAAQEGDWREAIRQWEECRATEPDNRGALLGLGSAYLSVGRFDDAILVLRRAIALGFRPEAPIRRSLAVAYLESGLLEDAAAEGEAALRFAPSDVATLVTLVRIRTNQGDPDEAARLAARVRALAPGAPAVERALEEALVSAGDED